VFKSVTPASELVPFKEHTDG